MHLRRRSTKALPSPFEEYTGEVNSPVGHEVEIKLASEAMTSFAADFNAGRIPAVSLKQLGSAADLLWTYAGCPTDDVWGVSFFDSPEAAASFRRVAEVIPKFLEYMTALIHIRRQSSNALAESQQATAEALAQDSDSPYTHDDLPF